MTTPRLSCGSSGLDRRTLLAGLTTLGAAALAGCGVRTDPLDAPAAGASRAAASPTPAAKVVVGAGSFAESGLLAEIYAQALVAKGIPATVKRDLGSRADYLDALRTKTISVLPAYTGDLLLHLDQTASAATAEEIETALKPLVSDAGLALLKTSTAIDQDVYCVTAKLSSETGLISMVDLKKLADTAVLGGPASLADRSYGPPGLDAIYQATFKQFRAYTSDTNRLADLLADKIQVATFYTTQSLIADNGLIQLTDPEGMILPQNIVPVVRPVVADDPQAVAAINAVQAALTTQDLASLGRKVVVDQTPARQVALAYLNWKKLI